MEPGQRFSSIRKEVCGLAMSDGSTAVLYPNAVDGGGFRRSRQSELAMWLIRHGALLNAPDRSIEGAGFQKVSSAGESMLYIDDQDATGQCLERERRAQIEMVCVESAAIGSGGIRIGSGDQQPALLQGEGASKGLPGRTGFGIGR